MRIRLLIACAIGCALLGLRADAQETWTLAAPVTQPAVSVYTVDFLFLNWRAGTVEVQVTDNAGNHYFKAYNGATSPTGASLMIALNKANLTVNTLNMRILSQLAASGVIGAGSNTGAPQ